MSKDKVTQLVEENIRLKAELELTKKYLAIVESVDIVKLNGQIKEMETALASSHDLNRRHLAARAQLERQLKDERYDRANSNRVPTYAEKRQEMRILWKRADIVKMTSQAVSDRQKKGDPAPTEQEIYNIVHNIKTIVEEVYRQVPL